MVYLPAKSRQNEEAKNTACLEQTQSPQGDETVLLVDDLKDLRQMGSRVLRSAGYQVMTAASGEEALEILKEKQNKIDLVIMDLGMPGMGGHQAMLEIHKQDAKAKVVIASGYAKGEQVQEALNAGASTYVAKPYLAEDLLKKVRNVLDG